MSKSAHSRSKPIRIVALGGGTGLSMLLRGLKQHIANSRENDGQRPIADIAAVVTVTDDGGSSGRLRREYSILPPGDIRNCMVALSPDEALLGRLFQYRFPAASGRGRGLSGHSFGNLFLTALTQVTGDFPEAVRLSGKVLAARGRIFPSTNANVTLEAELEDGRIVAGETKISQSRRRIHRVRLVPAGARPLPEVLDAIREADLILLGPGSLYTSIIPSLLVRGVANAILRARAECVYIANLMTQPGETDGYSVADHVRAVYDHTRVGLFDSVVVNRAPASSAALLRRYRGQGAEPVDPSLDELREMGLKYVTGDLLQQDGMVRHDQKRLARLLLSHFARRKPS
ncbi:MAG TPA: gluconeogenesis factor YvcK family protein [Candidatus Acidoferrales bacterium]|nr:gluconeogenesis factor YvcK family protein [Candidatus Acidoferrales bacterium]